MMKKCKTLLLPLLLAVCLFLPGCATESSTTPSFSLDDIPAFSGTPYVTLNDNEPNFTDSDLTTEAFEEYSPLDSLGRCGVAYANICQELMPKTKRGSIGQVKPTGWHTAKYDHVDGKYLYNRCHLIGHQLAGEDANAQNLITGTRYMNVDGMLPFENMVADYVKETDNHVLYRVTPIFEGQNLVASGVEMEALSVEDNGDGVCFHVYCYNAQPSVTIDYATGESWLAGEEPTESDGETYILNTNNHKFHKPDCSSVSTMKDSNKESFTGSRSDLIAQGYEPCGRCKP
jgi:DNA-entry nuclease